MHSSLLAECSFLSYCCFPLEQQAEKQILIYFQLLTKIVAKKASPGDLPGKSCGSETYSEEEQPFA